MTQVIPNPTPTAATPALPAWPADRFKHEPAWLVELRRQAMDRFLATGYPTRHTEEWRFTSLSPITQTDFDPSPTPPLAWPALSAVAPLLMDADAPRLVFVNGQYAPALSHLPENIAGLSIHPLPQLLTQDPDLLRELLAQDTLHRDPFSELNLALHDAGAAIVIAAEARIDQPIHLLSLAAQSAGPWVSHGRNLIHLGKGSQARFIEHYAGLPEAGVYWHDALTQITLDAGAKAEHYLLAEEGEQGRNISTLIARLADGAHLASHAALTGGALVRNNIHVELRGEHADALVNGLFVGKGRQTLDNHMRVIHGSAHCDSRQFYKGILADQSQGVFTGRIVVEPGAQKTDAKQTSRNLLLSDKARIHADPQLEIYADDVKCTHGATTGQLDDQAMFYLRSRGISAADARLMLIRAFAMESLDRMTFTPARDRLERQLLAILAGSLSPQEESS